jgi:hypothetical protein
LLYKYRNIKRSVLSVVSDNRSKSWNVLRVGMGHYFMLKALNHPTISNATLNIATSLIFVIHAKKENAGHSTF